MIVCEKKVFQGLCASLISNYHTLLLGGWGVQLGDFAHPAPPLGFIYTLYFFPNLGN